MSNQYLGWGWVGTPDGRQSHGEGIELARQFASKFDLPSDIGGCLVSPNHNTLEHPLFRMLYIPEQQIFGIGHYLSIFEHSTKRPGSFCGSFFITVTNKFPQRQGTNLYKFLLSSTQQHLEKLVNPSTFAYNSDVRLANCKIAVSGELLGNIHNNFIEPSVNFDLLPSFNKSLVIYCERERISQLIDMLISSELFKCFTNIYFSYSKDIVQNAQEKGFTCWNYEEINSIAWSIKELAGNISNTWIERIRKVEQYHNQKLQHKINEHDRELAQINQRHTQELRSRDTRIADLKSQLNSKQEQLDLQISRAVDSEYKLRDAQMRVRDLQDEVKRLRNRKDTRSDWSAPNESSNKGWNQSWNQGKQQDKNESKSSLNIFEKIIYSVIIVLLIIDGFLFFQVGNPFT